MPELMNLTATVGTISETGGGGHLAVDNINVFAGQTCAVTAAGMNAPGA